MVRCPYNDVMSFIYRYKPNKENKDIKILELGSGDGNNLWYLKKENFDVTGIELDSNSVKNAYSRLKEENLQVSIVEGDFTKIPFKDDEFDLVFDRGAITCVNLEDAKKVIDEVNRVLKKGGFFYFNPYSELDKDFFEGTLLSDGRVGEFKNPSRKCPILQFYSNRQVIDILEKNKWEIKEFNLLSKRELISSRNLNTTYFEVIVKEI